LNFDGDKFDIADFDGDGRYEACFPKSADANIIRSFAASSSYRFPVCKFQQAVKLQLIN